MNSQFKAILEVYKFFTKEKIPYVFIGGISLQYWGEPRFTRDVDVTILVDLGKEEEILKKIIKHFKPRISNCLDFALKNRVCLVQSKEGYEIDISLGIPGYEEELMKNAINFKINKKNSIRICSAEDLIIHKALAGREKDIKDIETIILRQGKKLNIKYIKKWLKAFSEILETREMLYNFERLWKKIKKSKNFNIK